MDKRLKKEGAAQGKVEAYLEEVKRMLL